MGKGIFNEFFEYGLDLLKSNNEIPSAVISKSSSTTATFTIPSSSFHLMFVSGAGGRKYVGILYCSSSGGITVKNIKSGSAFSNVSTTTNTFTVAWSSAGASTAFDFYIGSPAS